MLTKHKDILTSEILLQIDPLKRKGRRYYSIFVLALFGALGGFIIYTILSTKADRAFVLAMISALIMAMLMMMFIWVRVRPTALIFTHKGITDSALVGILWDEIELYNFIDVKDIGMKKAKRVLRLIPKKPPFYHFWLMGLPRYFFDRGLFFSESDAAKAEDLFRNKGIPREP